jgi:hypothetical protein
MYFKVHPSIAIPIGLALDLIVAYGIAKLIRFYGVG